MVYEELLGIPLLKIAQNDSVKFSLDSIILASFVSIKKNTKEVLDIGTGNAPIPLYLTLRTNAHITGVEIQNICYELAQKSVKINMKEEQITLLNKNILDLNYNNKFDIVISNPPFFKVTSDKVLNPDDTKALMRHEISLNLEELIICARKALKNKGVFALVHRPDRLTDIITLMRKYNIEPKRIRFVYPKKGSLANHVLIEGIKDAKNDGLKVLEPLYIYEEGNLTLEALSIYNGKVW